MSMPPITITLDHLRARCMEQDGCWLWAGATTQQGYPIIKNGGRGCLLARREAARLAGKAPAPRQPVETTCGHRLCINPAHLKPSSFSEVGTKAAARGAYSTLGRGRAIAQARRQAPGAKLRQEDAQAIRTSEESGPVLAARYGVNRSLINAIKRGEAWMEHDDANAFHIRQLVKLRRQIGSAANRLQREAEQGACA